MAVYVLVVIDIHDAEKYAGYGAAWPFESFTKRYGGEILMMSNEPEVEVIEGEWAGRLVVMKFPDREQAQAWYSSPDYAVARKIRWDSSTTNMVLLPGVDAQALASPTPQ